MTGRPPDRLLPPGSPDGRPPRRPRAVRLKTVMLLIAGVAAWLAVERASPYWAGWGLWWALLAAVMYRLSVRFFEWVVEKPPGILERVILLGGSAPAAVIMTPFLYLLAMLALAYGQWLIDELRSLVPR